MNSDFIKLKRFRRQFQAMNARVKALVFIASAVALISGLIIIVNILFPPLSFYTKPPDLTIQGHAWGTNNVNITLSVKNTGTKTVSVINVQINGSIVTTVTYSGSFSGATHALDVGAVGTITISYPFSSGFKYGFAVGTATGGQYGYQFHHSAIAQFTKS